MSKSTPDSMYRTLYENSMDAVLLSSPDGFVYAANPAACEMFLVTEAELCRRGRTGFVDEDDPAFHTFLAERELKGKARGELTFIRGDGSRFCGEASWAQFTADSGELRAALIIHDLSNRKQMETALAESEKRYRSVINSMGEGVVFQQGDGRITALNPAAERILGRTAEELMGLTPEDAAWETIHEDGSPFPVPEHPISLALSSGTPQRGVVMGIRVDGDLRWLSINADPVFDEYADSNRSTPKAAVATFQDISECRRANESLQDSEQRYRTIFENSPLGMFRSTIEGRFLEVNNALANMLGYTPEELTRDISDIGRQIYSDPQERQKNIYTLLRASEDVVLHYFNRYRRKDGREVLANLYLKMIRDKNDKPMFLEGIVEDVTESRMAENALRTSEARFRIFVDHVSDALFLHGENGVILDANHQACQSLGYSRDELIGMGPAQFDAELTPDDRKAIENQVIKGEIVTFESYHRRKDGSTFPVEVSIRPFMDGGRRVQISSARDITERKRANEALFDSEQRYRTIFENSPLGMFRSTIEGRMVEANRSLANLFGYDSATALINDINDIGKQLYVSANDRRDVIKKQFQSAKDVVHHPFNRYRRKDGREMLANLYLKTIRDDHGNPVLFEGIVEDVTEARMAEDALRASEARFRSFSDHAMDAFFLHGEKGVILDANRQACMNLGYGRDELIGMTPGQFDADLSQEYRDEFRARVDKGEIVTFDTHHRRKDGSIFPVEVRMRPFKSGDQQRYISTARDISERVQAEDDLRQINRELQAIDHCHQALLRIDNEPELLDEICRIICDEAGYAMAWVGFMENDEEKSVIPVAWAGVDDGYIKHVNLSWAEDSPRGQGPAGRAIRSGEVVYVQDFEIESCMAPWRDAALECGFRSNVVFPLKNDVGEVFGALTIYSSVPNAMTCPEIRLLGELADDLAFGIGVIRMRASAAKIDADLRRKSLELESFNMQLRQLAARREEMIETEKTEIARNVHDELGQLLTALKMRLSLLAVECGDSNTRLKQDIEYVEDLSDKAMVAARDVISALRPPSLDMGLALSLEHLAQQYAKNTGIACNLQVGQCENCEYDTGGNSICTTMYRIAQEGLTNVARYARANQVNITMDDSGEVCQLSIRDNGVGFDPEQVRDNAFGLIGIRERAEVLGGSFAIDSVDGKGTEIHIKIPRNSQLKGPKQST